EVGSVTEAGTGTPGTPGVPSTSGTLSDNVSDVDNGGALTDDLDFTIAGGGTYGSLSYDSASGAWTYTLNNADSDTEALNQGETATETFTYTVHDQEGATATATLTITIAGANDDPTPNDDEGGSVTESGAGIAGMPTATGALSNNVSDVDNAGALTDDLDFTVTGGGTYGTLSYSTETGQWTYTLHNGDSDTDSLNKGETAS